MALTKLYETDFGITLNYWRITRINENFDGSAEVYLGGYPGKEIRDLGKHALEYKTFNFSAKDVVRATAYQLIKESKPTVMTPYSAEYTNEAGELVPEQLEVVEESNIFADAIDC
jgi:hypothetical protein